MITTYKDGSSRFWLGVVVVMLTCYARDCRGASGLNPLLIYWITNSVEPGFELIHGTNTSEIVKGDPANYVSKLRSFGVRDANDLEQYLDYGPFQLPAACAILFLAATSKPLEPAVVDKLIGYYTNNAVLIDRLQYDGGPHQWISSSMLLYLGQYADRHPDELSNVVPAASRILKSKLRTAKGEAMIPPPEPDAIPVILSALKCKLFNDPELSRTVAELLIVRIRGPWLVPAEHVETMFSFVLRDSKAEPDFIAHQLSEAASFYDPQAASRILWLLNEAKDNAIATKALVEFSLGTKNKGILEGIRSGTINKQQAYDDLLKRKSLQLSY